MRKKSVWQYLNKSIEQIRQLVNVYSINKTWQSSLRNHTVNTEEHDHFRQEGRKRDSTS